MSPTPTPTPSPSPAPLLEDDGFSQLDHGVIPLAPGHPCLNSGSMKCILDHQQQTADELNAQSTSTMSAQEFNVLMDGHPSNAAPVIAGVVLSVLVLTAAAVAFIKRRRAAVTSPATAEA
jgi:hypothetical protein